MNMKAIVDRIREPSTWAALSVLFSLVGVNPVVVQLLGGLLDVAPHVADLVALVPAIGAAAAGVALPERKP